MQGLSNVDPVYTWVRLAQRAPVLIAIDNVPPGAGVRLYRNGCDPGRQGPERNALAKSPHPARDELLRIKRWSFGAILLHSGPFVSVTLKSAISWNCGRPRPLSFACGRKLRRARAAAPLPASEAVTRFF